MIQIPEADRQRQIAHLGLSTTLKHALTFNNFHILGQLDGMSYRDIAQLKRCGPRCLKELKSLVGQLHPQAGMVDPSPEPVGPVVRIPELARAFKLADLPISHRLERVLTLAGYKTMGDVDGVPIAQLYDMESCGRKCVNELLDLAQRAGDGEFSPRTDLNASALWQDMAMVVDTSIRAFSPRNRSLLWHRIHGIAGVPPPLERLGHHFGVSTERARQIVQECLLKIRRSAGPRLVEALRVFKLQQPFQKHPVSKTPNNGSKSLSYEHLLYDRIFTALVSDFPVD